MDITIVIITVAICFLIIKFAKNSKPKQGNRLIKTNPIAPKNSKPRQKVTPSTNPHAWPALNQFDFEVVGESYYQPALAKLAADHPAISSGANEIKPLTAHLIPDDYNEYDDNAVRVEINGLHIGYLSREDARNFRRRLGAKKLTGQITTCGAIITGGHINDGKTMSYGAALDIQPFGD